MKNISISVILPTYNESSWLPNTLAALDKSISNSKNLKDVEIIIVDDGSTDDTKKVINNISKQIKTNLIYIKQKNSGRFLARKKGIERANYEVILFIDSRVHIGTESLNYISQKLVDNPEKNIWNAHVYVYKKNNIYARFWDVITSVAWHKYFSNPREVSYGIDEFDYFPKGTTCFLAPKKLINEAIINFESNSNNSKESNDDTLLIKFLATKQNINISPDFNCMYFSRSSLDKFLKHAYHRGQVFVDGFLRKDGNRYYLPLLFFLILSVPIVALLVALLFSAPYLCLFLLLLFFLILYLVLTIYKVKSIDSFSFLFLLPLFASVYGLGIWIATINNRLAKKQHAK
ncbi:MAG: glycosyltransferase family A protein [Candidatus Saccharibacteria bacterium]